MRSVLYLTILLERTRTSTLYPFATGLWRLELLHQYGFSSFPLGTQYESVYSTLLPTAPTTFTPKKMDDSADMYGNVRKFCLLYGISISELSIIHFTCRHTHEAVDQVFSRISARLGKTNCPTVEEFLEEVRTSFTPNLNMIPLRQTLDIKGFLGDCIAPEFSEIRTAYNFVIKKGNQSGPGSVFTFTIASARSDSKFTDPLHPLLRMPDSKPCLNANKKIFAVAGTDVSQKLIDNNADGAFRKASAQIYKFGGDFDRPGGSMYQVYRQSWDTLLERLLRYQTLPAGTFGGFWPLSAEEFSTFMSKFPKPKQSIEGIVFFFNALFYLCCFSEDDNRFIYCFML